MRLILFFSFFLLSGCHLKSPKDDILKPSYRMLSFSYDSKYLSYDSDYNALIPPPINEKDFYLLKDKAKSGDSDSNLLMFKLFYKDSNCNYFSFGNIKPDFICAKAVDYLIDSVNSNPNNNLALYEMSKLYYNGIVLEKNDNKAMGILDRIVKKGGRNAVLVCDYLVEITLFDDDRNIKDLNKARYYANSGAENGSEKCQKYRDDIDSYMNNKRKNRGLYGK